MKIPISWLSEYVPIVFSPAEIAHKLTMAGIESTYIEGRSSTWDENILIGKVVSLYPHPNADRLKLATINTGNSDLTVVCGAPNIQQGQHIALAKVGAQLFDSKSKEQKTLSATKIRGVLSEGMVCSELELGISNAHEGILVLDPESPVGIKLSDYINDDAIEIEVTPNRGDCLSVIGVAREIAAFSNREILEPDVNYIEAGRDITVKVAIENPELCDRYTASVIRNIIVSDSPLWLQTRLLQSDQRPINAIVDITNYVMLEMGQPLHAFDLDKIEGQSIFARAAYADEKIQTLDGVNHLLEPTMCVIADTEKPIALAGIMGGLSSEVTGSTSNILIEAASFNALSTRKTSSTLKIRTEASTRFEKGLHPTLAEKALRRATQLILEITEGKADNGIADDYLSTKSAKEIVLTHDKIIRLLGVDFTNAQINDVFISLGFRINEDASGDFLISTPYWRSDISIEEDLIEEIARVLGYESIPALPLTGPIPTPIPQPVGELRENIRDLMVEAGLQEIITHTLVNDPAAFDQGSINNPSNSLKVLNPLSSDHQYLRKNLRGSILKVISKSVRHHTRGLAIFEIGRGFLPQPANLPEEKEMAVICMAGKRSSEGLWAKQDLDDYDFFDVKGIIEIILSQLGISFELRQSSDFFLHPGKSADIYADNHKIGILGNLHPNILSELDIDSSSAVFAELDISALSNIPQHRVASFKNYSRFPVAARDLAFVVDIETTAEEIDLILRSAPEVSKVVLFDYFVGDDLPPGKKSLAFRLELQSDFETLKSEQINQVIANLVSEVSKTKGGILRA